MSPADSTLSGRDSLAKLLVQAFRWFEDALAADPDTAHLPRLSGSQFMTLVSLDADGTSISELARRVGVTRQAMHQMVGELEKSALVETTDSPNDGRIKLVCLSLLGRTLDDKAKAALAGLEKRLADRIGQAAVSGLHDALSADWGPPGR